MALICPACGTENRSVAKFCIECIAALPTGFAATQIVAPPLPPRDEGPPSLPSALAAFASAASSPPLPLGWGETPILPLPPAVPAPSPWRWVVAALALVLVLLATGWWLGRWLFETPSAAPSPPQVAGRVVVEPVAVAPQGPQPEAVAVPEAAAAAPAAVPDPQAAQAWLAPGESLVRDEPAPLAATASGAADASGPPVATVVSVAAPAARRVAAPSPALFAPCEGLGFVRASRCRVDLCSQPAHARKAACAQVLAQQRRMDEKRNPTLAD